MKKPLLLAATLLLAPYLAHAASEPAATQSPAVRDGRANNTGINERDRNDKTLTPMDQLNNQADLRIAQDIRQALMKEELSMDAKNIKVIARNGVVTLRGPVESAAEIKKIEAMVKAVLGVKSVDNQLQVK